jgi:hypothetical protein
MAIVYKHRKDAIPQLPQKFAPVQPVLERLLAKLPAGRYANATEAARALEDTLTRWRARAAQR